MIKEKKSKKRKQFTLKDELQGYAKTVGISFLVAAIFTVILSYRAKNEMMKNLYAPQKEKTKAEQLIAQQIISHSDLITTLHDKNYSVVMRVGDLYETAGDYAKAEYAYHLAAQKIPNGKYMAYQKLAVAMINQNKTEDAEEVINSVEDTNNLNLIRFKTRANIVLGDKYYSIGKFLKSAAAYENANYYYTKLTKKDKEVQNSINKRLVNSYIEAAAVMVKNGYNSDAARFLKKALKYEPNNLKLQYRLAIVYADLDPIVSVNYFEPIISKIPQEIDRDIYGRVLMKAANIMDIQGDSIKAKYYRYKIHSLDVYQNNKVVFRDDVEVSLDSVDVKKVFFTYRIKTKFSIKNVSSQDINKLAADFILYEGNEQKELFSINCASKRKPLYSNGGELSGITINFGKNIFTKHELERYHISVYLYKEPKYKTKAGSFYIPLK